MTVTIEPGTVEYLDDEDLDAPVIDINEYRRKKAYDEFWSDPCWSEPPSSDI